MPKQDLPWRPRRIAGDVSLKQGDRLSDRAARLDRSSRRSSRTAATVVTAAPSWIETCWSSYRASQSLRFSGRTARIVRGGRGASRCLEALTERVARRLPREPPALARFCRRFAGTRQPELSRYASRQSTRTVDKIAEHPRRDLSALRNNHDGATEGRRSGARRTRPLAPGSSIAESKTAVTARRDQHARPPGETAPWPRWSAGPDFVRQDLYALRMRPVVGLPYRR
jgi:hypothetical protein